MANGDDKAASQAGHMAAPTSTVNAQLTLAKGEPSTQGAKRTCSQRPGLSVANVCQVFLSGIERGVRVPAVYGLSTKTGIVFRNL
jgi:hypothetical protein